MRDDYRTFTRITKEPKSIGAKIDEGCIGFPGQEQMGKETGPHSGHYVHYYLNVVAQSHRDARIGTAYPPGSVIVKEKLWGGDAGPEDIGRTRDFTRVTAVAGMIKRKPKSNPTTGDWEFFYFSNASLSKDGKVGALGKAKDLKSCVSCHSNAMDMVFGRFDKPYVMPKAADGGKALKLEVAPKESAPLNPKK